MNKLLKIIKDIHCINGYPKGIQKTNFSIALDTFKKDYRLKSNQIKLTNTRVVSSGEEMIQLIKDKDLKAHHLTCASKIETNTNTALCVHYNQSKTRYSIALPRITHIK